MATSLSTGHLYFIEAAGDLGAKTNWITTGAGDPDTIDLDQFTEPTTVCSIEFPEDLQKRFNTGITVTHLGAASFATKWENKFYAILAYGLETDIENASKVERFLMSARHTSAASATFKQYYLVGRWKTGKFWEFTDYDDGRKEYCPVVVTGGAVIWSDSEMGVAYMRLNCQSVWS